MSIISNPATIQRQAMGRGCWLIACLAPYASAHTMVNNFLKTWCGCLSTIISTLCGIAHHNTTVFWILRRKISTERSLIIFMEIIFNKIICYCSACFYQLRLIIIFNKVAVPSWTTPLSNSCIWLSADSEKSESFITVGEKRFTSSSLSNIVFTKTVSSYVHCLQMAL